MASVLDEIADEVFGSGKPAKSALEGPQLEGGPGLEPPPATASARSVLDSVADEVFGGTPTKTPEPEPGLLSRAASAVTSAVTEAAAPMAQALGFKPSGPVVSPDAGAAPKSPALPGGPNQDLTATAESAAVGPGSRTPTPPIQVKLGPVSLPRGPVNVGTADVSPDSIAAINRASRRQPIPDAPVPFAPIAAPDSVPVTKEGEYVVGTGAEISDPGRQRLAADYEAKKPRLIREPPKGYEGLRPADMTVPEQLVAAGGGDVRAARFRAEEKDRAFAAIKQDAQQRRVPLEVAMVDAGYLPDVARQALFGFSTGVTGGFGTDLAEAAGLTTPETSAPLGTAGELAHSTGHLAGFVLGPMKITNSMLKGGQLMRALTPVAGESVMRIAAKDILRSGLTLGTGTTLSGGSDIAKAPTWEEALEKAAGHAKDGALMGGVFGAVGSLIPGKSLPSLMARLSFGAASLDVLRGTNPLDQRPLVTKAYDYFVDFWFLRHGNNPRRTKALLDAEVAARRKETYRHQAKGADAEGPGGSGGSGAAPPLTPLDLLKSVSDKARERADAVAARTPGMTAADRMAVERSELSRVFAEEVGDVSTQTTATELRQAKEVAELKTGGVIPQREADYELRVGPPKRPELIVPGGQPGPAVGPTIILGPTGRPAEAMPPTVVPESPRPLRMALDVATARGGTRPGAPPPRAPQAPAGELVMAETRSPAAATRPQTFKAFVEASGRRWPLTAREPGFVAMREGFDSFSKGIYESRRGPTGWAVTNRFTGEAVDHLPTGAKAQLESNRLNATVTLDSWRQAQVPAPVRMVLPPPKPAEDLSAKPAPAPKIEAGTPAAAEQARQREIVKPGPPPPAEPPGEAKVPAPPAATPVATGREQEVRVPAGARYKTQYQIVEAKDLIPSHNAQTFAKDPRYPEGVQNRPYHSDKSEQAKVIRQGQDFEPLFLVSPQPSSGGTPIVAPDSNVVLSGNSRSMSLLRTLGTPAFDRYKTALKEMAPALGLRPEAIDQAQQPVLVRRLVGTDTTPEFYRRFAAETNQGFKQSLNTEAAAVSQGQAIKPETMEWIAGQVDALGENASLREFLRSGRDREIVRRFIQDGVFTDRDLNRVVDGKTGLLNEDGKRLVERAILGNVVRDSDLLAQTPDSVLAKIERSLGAIAKIRGRGEAWDLSGDLTQALRTTAEVKAAEAGSVAALRSQGSLLGAAQPSPRADALADALLRMKPTEFRAAMDRYADEAQRDVRGQETLGFAKPQTPAAAFKDAFGGGVPEPIYLAGEAESRLPSGSRPTEARRAGEAEGEFMKSPTLAPPLTQAEPSQVSMTSGNEASKQRETAPSFQMRADAERSMIGASSTPRLTQPTGNVQDLLDAAASSKPSLEAALAAIAARIDGVDFLGARVKGDAKVIDKMQRKAPAGPETFDDFLAGRLQADSAASLEQAAAALRAKWPEHVEDNFLESANSWGYRATHFTVKGPGGFLMEVQLVPAPVADYQTAGGGHKIYNRWRAGPQTAEEQAPYLAAKAESNARFQEAYGLWTAPREEAPSAAEPVAPQPAERTAATPRPEGAAEAAAKPALTMTVRRAEREPERAPAEFHSLQERPAGRPPIEVFTLTRDIPGHDRGSTVSRETLEQAGYTVPARPADARVGEVYRPETKPSLTMTVGRAGTDRALERGPAGEPTAAENQPAKGTTERLKADLEELFRISGGSGDVVDGPGGQRPAPPPLSPEHRQMLYDYGREAIKDGRRDFPSWARQMVEDLGAGVAPHLPDAWSRIYIEAARTQTPVGRPAAEAADQPKPEKSETARRAKTKAEREPIPATAPPIEPPPRLSDPQMKAGLSQQVIDAATDLFLKAGVPRDPKVLLADQVMGMLRDGQIKLPDMVEALKARGLSFTDFGASLYRENVRDAARELGALGRLARAIKDAEKAGAISKEDLADLRSREPEIDEHLAPLSYWRRADNIRRGGLVTQLATAVRNFESQVGRVGLDVMDQSLQGGLQRAFGKTQTQSGAAALGELANIFRQMPPGRWHRDTWFAGRRHREMKAKVDAILEAFPKETSRLLESYHADIAAAARRDGAAGAVDRVFAAAEGAVGFFNTANRAQEFIVRRSVFEGELRQALQAKGKALDTIIRENRIGEIDAESLKTAVGKALEITFSESPLYGSWAHSAIKAVNGSPATLAIPFPRFLWNSSRFLFSSFNPLGVYRLADPREWRAAHRSGDYSRITRGFLGTGMLVAAWAMQELYNDEGNKWYEMRIPGSERSVDIRPFNPYSAYFFLGDLARRARTGTLGRMSGGDILKGLLSFDPSLRFGSYSIEQLVTRLSPGSTESWTDAIEGIFGNIFAGILMPMQSVTDVLAFFDPELAVTRETSKDPFWGPIKAKVPWAATGAEPRYPWTNVGPMRRELPAVRQLTGATVTHKKNDFERELDRLAFSFNEIRGASTGDRELDNVVAGEMGQRVEEAADRISSARYQAASDTQRALLLRDWLHKIRVQARAKVRSQDPQGWREVMDEKRPWRERAEIQAAEEEGRRPAGVRRR